jgi:hypothetical protein
MRTLVDGMGIAWRAEPAPKARAGDTDAGDPDWVLEIERGDPDQGLERVAWTGDVREAGEPWARFGREGDVRVVLLEGVACLRAVRGERTARIRHDLGPALDEAVERRLEPYLVSLLGRLVLHAAAVVFPAGAVLLLGGSGAGKSTTALALDAIGVPVLADDHVAVDAPAHGPAVAHASFPVATVDADAAAAFAAERRTTPFGAAKRAVALSERARPASARVLATAFLARGPALSRTPMRAPEAAARLLREAAFVADPADDAAQAARLDACVHLLRFAPASTLVVPSGLERLASALPRLAALFEARA